MSPLLTETGAAWAAEGISGLDAGRQQRLPMQETVAELDSR